MRRQACLSYVSKLPGVRINSRRVAAAGVSDGGFIASPLASRYTVYTHSINMHNTCAAPSDRLPAAGLRAFCLLMLQHFHPDEPLDGSERSCGCVCADSQPTASILARQRPLSPKQTVVTEGVMASHVPAQVCGQPDGRARAQDLDVHGPVRSPVPAQPHLPDHQLLAVGARRSTCNPSMQGWLRSCRLPSFTAHKQCCKPAWSSSGRPMWRARHTPARSMPGSANPLSNEQ